MIRVAPMAILALMAASTMHVEAQAVALNRDDRARLATYARDTWRSLDALAAVGRLPADSLWRTADGWSATYTTSPSNVAAYLWSIVAAERLGLIDRDDAGHRLEATLGAIESLERSHGFFYNWYDPRTGDRLKIWPGGGKVRGLLSTVDNGWLAAALMVVGGARPEFKDRADRIMAPMNFRFFYDDHDPLDPVAHPGLLRGGYYPSDANPDAGSFTYYHYGVLNTEPRIASYIGIARGDLPSEHYYRMTRSKAEPASPARVYRGVSVVESSRACKGGRLLPSWDGTMFEALMVPLFVPEATWSPAGWGANHELYARAQIEYGLNDAKLGTWGISASTDAKGGYHAFGVGPLGLSPRAGSTKNGRESKVVTPHASFLALPYAPREAMDNLQLMAERFPCYDAKFGFLDAVDVETGKVSDGVLVLDQGMILAAIANVLDDGVLQRAFVNGLVEANVKPLLVAEQFEVGPAPKAGLDLSPSLALAAQASAARLDLPAAGAIATALLATPVRPLSSPTPASRPIPVASTEPSRPLPADRPIAAMDPPAPRSVRRSRRRALVVLASRPDLPGPLVRSEERGDALDLKRLNGRRRIGKPIDRRRALG